MSVISKGQVDLSQQMLMHNSISTWAAQLPECSSAAVVAAKTQQAKGLKMSPSSITRLLRRKWLQHLRAKVVPMLTASQKLATVRSARAALRRELWNKRQLTVTLLMAQGHDHRQQVLHIA